MLWLITALRPEYNNIKILETGEERWRLCRSSLRNVVASGSIILTVAFNSGNTGKSLCSFWKLIN